MRENHLIEPLRLLLESAEGDMSEYAIMQSLQSQGWLEPIPMGDTVALFANHFLVYNALYQLKQYYKARHQSLFISALSIQLINHNESGDSRFLRGGENKSTLASGRDNQAEMAELEAYYLDFKHLEVATEASVEALLRSFWSHHVNDSEYSDALHMLGLDVDATPEVIKKAYRQQAMLHHPDRGGDLSTFQSVQRAYAVARRK